jgi:hypothetical protein
MDKENLQNCNGFKGVWLPKKISLDREDVLLQKAIIHRFRPNSQQ